MSRILVNNVARIISIYFVACSPRDEVSSWQIRTKMASYEFKEQALYLSRVSDFIFFLNCRPYKTIVHRSIKGGNR
jgi:hypothetical protein